MYRPLLNIYLVPLKRQLLTLVLLFQHLWQLWQWQCMELQGLWQNNSTKSKIANHYVLKKLNRKWLYICIIYNQPTTTIPTQTAWYSAVWYVHCTKEVPKSLAAKRLYARTLILIMHEMILMTWSLVLHHRWWWCHRDSLKLVSCIQPSSGQWGRKGASCVKFKILVADTVMATRDRHVYM